MPENPGGAVEPTRYTFSIPRRPGSLALSASSRQIAGWGFGALTLTASRYEEDATPLAADEPREVRLESSGSDFRASSSIVPEGQSSASLEVRPSGLGDVELRAEANGLAAPPLKLNLSFPLASFLATPIGGAFGGAASWLVGKPRRSLTEEIAEGVLGSACGVGIALLMHNATTLSQEVVGTELGIALLAMAAGFVGGAIYGHVASLLMPWLKKSDDGASNRDAGGTAGHVGSS